MIPGSSRSDLGARRQRLSISSLATTCLVIIALQFNAISAGRLVGIMRFGTYGPDLAPPPPAYGSYPSSAPTYPTYPPTNPATPPAYHVSPPPLHSPPPPASPSQPTHPAMPLLSPPAPQGPPPPLNPTQPAGPPPPQRPSRPQSPLITKAQRPPSAPGPREDPLVYGRFDHVADSSVVAVHMLAVPGTSSFLFMERPSGGNNNRNIICESELYNVHAQRLTCIQCQRRRPAMSSSVARTAVPAYLHTQFTLTPCRDRFLLPAACFPHPHPHPQQCSTRPRGRRCPLPPVTPCSARGTRCWRAVMWWWWAATGTTTAHWRWVHVCACVGHA